MSRMGRTTKRPAMTLIELIAGLVILGSVLAALAVARGRFARQWAAADRKLHAVKALDALIAEWMQAPAPQIPVNRQGALPDVKNCVWRARASRHSGSSKLNAEVVRVEVFDRADAEKANAPPIVTVDLLVHVPQRRAGTQVDPINDD